MRTEFEQYRAMRAKMSYLQEQLINAPVVCDTVSGSSPEWPYTKQCMAISGVDGPKVAAIRRAGGEATASVMEHAMQRGSSPNMHMLYLKNNAGYDLDKTGKASKEEEAMPPVIFVGEEAISD
jgi:hypothetical protein